METRVTNFDRLAIVDIQLALFATSFSADFPKQPIPVCTPRTIGGHSMFFLHAFYILLLMSFLPFLIFLGTYAKMNADYKKACREQGDQSNNVLEIRNRLKNKVTRSLAFSRWFTLPPSFWPHWQHWRWKTYPTRALNMVFTCLCVTWRLAWPFSSPTWFSWSDIVESFSFASSAAILSFRLWIISICENNIYYR